MTQPPRTEADGPVSVTRSGDNIIVAAVVPLAGTTSAITLTPHNAWRVLGLLAFILGVKLPAKVAKGIKL